MTNGYMSTYQDCCQLFWWFLTILNMEFSSSSRQLSTPSTNTTGTDSKGSRHLHSSMELDFQQLLVKKFTHTDMRQAYFQNKLSKLRYVFETQNETSNDILYGSDANLIMELEKMIGTLIQIIFEDIDHLTKQNRKAESEKASFELFSAISLFIQKEV